MQTFPEVETNFLLAGSVGHLEVIATPQLTEAQAKPITAIICHPHSLHGGSMTNKVVSTMARAFANLGLRTVRFNFRGVGRSEGVYADGVGERDDLLAVLAWVRLVCPDDVIWLAGFSFGVAVSAQVAAREPVARLISIAPPVPRWGLSDLPPITCPWLIIQGEKDEVVNPEDVYAWVEGLNPKPQLIKVPNTGHFFHGMLIELRSLLEGVLV